MFVGWVDIDEHDDIGLPRLAAQVQVRDRLAGLVREAVSTGIFPHQHQRRLLGQRREAAAPRKRSPTREPKEP